MVDVTSHCTKAHTPPLESLTTLIFFISVCSDKCSISILVKSVWSILDGRLGRRIRKLNKRRIYEDTPADEHTGIMRKSVLPSSRRKRNTLAEHYPVLVMLRRWDWAMIRVVNGMRHIRTMWPKAGV